VGRTAEDPKRSNDGAKADADRPKAGRKEALWEEGRVNHRGTEELGAATRTPEVRERGKVDSESNGGKRIRL